MNEQTDLKDTSYNLIIRTKNFNDLPDVENYVRSLHKQGYFKNLINENKFTVEEVQKKPFSRLCKIFFRKHLESLETGDIIIFKNSGEYEFYIQTSP